jgi:hypothetical protein
LGHEFGHGENDVEVFHRQQLGLALFQPAGARQSLALGAMPVAAGAILNVCVLALAAPFDHTAQGGSTAVFDSLHQPLLLQRQPVRLPVSGPVESKDVGQLQGWRWHDSSA